MIGGMGRPTLWSAHHLSHYWFPEEQASLADMTKRGCDFKRSRSPVYSALMIYLMLIDRNPKLITVNDDAIIAIGAEFARNHLHTHADFRLGVEIGKLGREHGAFVKLNQRDGVRCLLLKACWRI